MTYCVFDLLMENGEDITTTPLVTRKAHLAQLFEAHRPTHALYFQHLSQNDVPIPISWLHAQTMQPQPEGIVAKRASSTYRPGERSADWYKLERSGAVPAGHAKYKA